MKLKWFSDDFGWCMEVKYQYEWIGVDLRRMPAWMVNIWNAANRDSSLIWEGQTENEFKKEYHLD